jgi:hypothetical protein
MLRVSGHELPSRCGARFEMPVLAPPRVATAGERLGPLVLGDGVPRRS